MDKSVVLQRERNHP
ncbi:hypothetical protein YPPY01_1687, partial [Yersinia pestis PY-01]